MKRVKDNILHVSKNSQLLLILLIQIFVGFFLVTVSLFLFLKIAKNVFEDDLVFFDTAITQTIYLLRSPLMTEIMKIITFFGGQTAIIAGLIITIWYLFSKNKKETLVFFFILSFGVLLNLLLKDIFGRARPDFLPLLEEETFSFPSGHAMNSFIFYTSLSFFVFRKNTHHIRKWGLMISSAILIFLIGVSRVYLGVHFPSDVLAGYIAGFWWFVTAILFENLIIFFQLLRGHKNNS